MPFSDCLEMGGRPATKEELDRLKKMRADLLSKLGKLGNIQLDETIITSLIHPNDDVTVEKATKRKGKRYGFYQSYRRVKNEN